MVENYSSGCPESQFLGAGPRNLSVPNYSNKTDEEHLCMVEGEREGEGDKAERRTQSRGWGRRSQS